MEKLFRSRVRVKLLKEFFLNREEEFYVRELAKITGENLNSISRELKNLLNSGIIMERKKGNQRLYRVNANSPIHEELRRIILKTVGLGDVFKKNLSELKAIKYTLIYGSFASGEESEGSDVDLLIVGNVDEEKIINVIRKLESTVGREVNYILWNEEEFKKKIKQKHYLLLDIVEKPLIMVVGDDNEFRKTVKG